MATNAPSPALAPPISVQLGDVRVTAISDGYFDLEGPFLVLPDGTPFDGGPSPLHIDVNTFLIETPDHRILVDTGCGNLLGPTVNQLLPNLDAIGMTPDRIDTILCTHIHPDHTNGLIDSDGAARFPNAHILVHQREVDFWLSEAEMSRAPEAIQGQFVWAQRAFRPYAGRIEPFTSGRLVAGIEALPLFGHTPGHSGFLIDGGEAQLLIWGDLVHAIREQARHPDIAFLADVDQEGARETRRRMFDRVASDAMMIAGMHLPRPGFGRLERDGRGYGYCPC